jgi:hypothetical protein
MQSTNSPHNFSGFAVRSLRGYPMYNSGFDNFILCQAKLCQAKQSNSTGTGAES